MVCKHVDTRKSQEVIVSRDQGEIKDFCGRSQEVIGGVSMRKTDRWNGERHFNRKWRFYNL